MRLNQRMLSIIQGSSDKQLKVMRQVGQYMDYLIKEEKWDMEKKEKEKKRNQNDLND